MQYFAHTAETPDGQPDPDTSKWQKLSDHLREVGELAGNFAAAFGAREEAKLAGLLHDLGKYRDEFQEYLRGQRKGGSDTHHAVYGAGVAANKLRNVALAYSIAGHHSGLHNAQGDSGLRELINKPAYAIEQNLESLINKFRNECGDFPAFSKDFLFLNTNTPDSRFKAEFFTRMIFSALVDADFLNTEAFYKNCSRPSVPSLNEDSLAEKLIAKLNTARIQKAKQHSSTLETTPITKIRNEIYEQCLNAGEMPQSFFSLTVPTGGGKTLSGMAFALSHARKHNLRRIIVVIPYLSIIEQNAAEYRRILDPDGSGILVENHSAVEVAAENLEASAATEANERSPLILAAENWDAPIIITTSVQFIESLFSNKPSRCRKLHNIARSVILFDEVQTLPVHLLEPLLSVWRELRDQYGVSFVFLSATQPAFQKQANLINGFDKTEITEISNNTLDTFNKLQRVSFKFPKPDETKSWEDLANEMLIANQVMCIVNIRKHAFALWNCLQSKLKDEDKTSLFHLSSAMCAEHRLHVIGKMHDPREGSIRWRLQNNKPCRVVSTQLVEAGVDLDFPLLYRALAPLDSIVQAAGRCNRENRMSSPGEVIIFTPEDKKLPPGIYKLATEETANIITRLTDKQLGTDPSLFADYFNRLYSKAATDYQRSGEDSIQQERSALNFRNVAHKVKVIDETGKSVIVPFGGINGKAMKIIREIKTRLQSKSNARFNRNDLRILQRFIVNIRHNDFQMLLVRGQVEELLPNLEINILNEGSYHNDLGVIVDERAIEDFIL